MPPLPILFIALGVVSHAPFSFIYHWHYCTTLPPGKPRFDHWSRKLDQAFIHVTSAFVSYGTSGSWDFFVANAAFNAHCVWRNLVSKTVSMVLRIFTPSMHLKNPFPSLLIIPFLKHFYIHSTGNSTENPDENSHINTSLYNPVSTSR
jgi:hypothetical protein